MKLVIFDMDQTLVEVIDMHDRAACRVFQDFFNIDASLTEMDYAGRSLGESFQVLAASRGIPESEVRDKLPLMLEAYGRAFADSLPPDGARFVLPGVVPLLDELRAAGHFLALYTGDSPAVARAVLEATGLGEYFPYRFYGTDVPARADMIRQAAVTAARVTGRTFQGRDVVVIGDSVRDIEAGRACGALVITVATGKHTRARLEAAGPDYLFDNLEDTAAVRRVIETPGDK
jgi:phosphoglycolate phosphatase